jgi:hypothetical protein
MMTTTTSGGDLMTMTMTTTSGEGSSGMTMINGFPGQAGFPSQ